MSRSIICSWTRRFPLTCEPPFFVSPLLFSDHVDPRGTTLATWDINDRLSDISVPTLVINGKDDIAQDFVIQGFLDHIPRSQQLKFSNSSHTPFWEERAAYMLAVNWFLY